MARLCAHGDNRQIDYVSYRMAVCQDGTVLKNHGAGWKVFGILKPGQDWLSVYREMIKRQDEKAAKFPAYAKFYRAILDLCPGLKMRWYLVSGLKTTGHDPDGLYVDLDEWPETSGRFSFEDIKAICGLYDAAIIEQQTANNA